jgi:hypothetical protein
MDHKRGYNLVEQAHEYAARKRFKDLSHSGSLFAAATRCNSNNNNNNNNNNSHDANTTTRAKANKHQEVEKGSQQAQQQSAHAKHIEDATYRRLLPVVKKVCLFGLRKTNPHES